MNLERTLDASSEVVSLTEIKNQLRITTDADNASLRLFNASVRQTVEDFLGQTLVTSTWEYKLDSFSSEIRLPMGPIQSIATISYIDTDGNPQTFTDFQFDKRGRLKPAYDFDWPDTRAQFDAVTITYIAGRVHAGDVPEQIKHAMLLLIGGSDVGRESVVIGAGVIVSQNPAAMNILMPLRRWNI